MPAPETLRLFVAIELPGSVREALGRLQHELQRRGMERLRWVRPEGIHLTLKFLGATPVERLPAISDVLAGVAAETPPHQLVIGRPGTFGGSRPRVVWVDLSGDIEAATAVQNRIETALDGLGFARESRRWSPHLTLARVRPEETRQAAALIPRALEGVRVPIGVIRVRDISLMRSILRPSGAVYERIEAFPLSER